MSKTIKGRISKGNRGTRIQFKLDGKPCFAYQGETIATALLANGNRTFRLTQKEKEPRSLYCGMGCCFECLVEVNGIQNIRACMTYVEPDMEVETGVGENEKLGEDIT